MSAVAPAMLLSLEGAHAAQPPAVVPRPDATLLLRITKSPAAADCPDAAVLAASVNAQVRRRAVVLTAGTSESSAPIVVEMDRTSDGYWATIRRVGSAGGYRQIRHSGSTCAGLDDALSLALVILVDGLEKGVLPVEEEALDASAAPGATSPDASGSAPPRVSRAEPPPTATSAASASPHGRLGLGALVSGGVLRGPGFGLTADLNLRWNAGWSLTGGGFWLLPQAENYWGGQVHVSILAASLRPCRRVVGFGNHLELLGCAVWQMGTIFGSGEGYPNATTSSPWWMAAGLGPCVDGGAIGPIGFRAYAELIIPLRAQRFRVGDSVAYETGRVGGAGGVVAWVSIW